MKKFDRKHGRAVPGFVKFLLRRFRSIIAVTTLTGIIAIAFAMAQPPKYSAIATMLIAPDRDDVEAADGKPLTTIPEAGPAASQQQLLGSAEFATVLIDRLGLSGDPAWNPGLRPPGVWAAILAQLGAPSASLSNANSAKLALMRKVSAALKVQKKGTSYVLDIIATAPNPDQAADLANAAMSIYLDHHLSRRYAAADAASDWMSQKLAEQKAKLDAKDVEIAALLYQSNLSTSDLTPGVQPQNPAASKLQGLVNEADTIRASYQSLQQHYQELVDAAPNGMTKVKVVAEAIAPISASSSSRSTLVGLGILLSVLCGLGAGAVIELLDEGVRGAADAPRKTGRNVLASIPLLRTGNLKATDLQGDAPLEYLLAKPMSAYAESLRNLRAAVVYSAHGAPPKTICISSARPKEGKTTTALGLARIAALSGQNVLIIDCDLRRNAITKLLGLQSGPGVLDVLVGDAAWRDVILNDPSTSLKVLPSGESFFSPGNVFGSIAMAKLLDEMRTHFSLVILDAPSVLGAPETKVISAQVDQTIIVARWNKTSGRVLRQSIRRLEASGGNVSGVALNFVDPKRLGTLTPSDTANPVNYTSWYYAS